METTGRRVTAWLAALAVTASATAPALRAQAAAAPAQGAAAPAAPTTKTTWYFYTVNWGHQDEFLDLFQKNHYPVLKAQQQAGRFASIRTYAPQYHGDGRADWTFAVELVENVGHTGAPTEEEIIKKLYPDQVTFRKEEQRRFELLLAHWDVPLNELNLDTRKPSR